MAVAYQVAHRNACANAITALGNRIGLYVGGTRVGTVSADTTWGAAVDGTGPDAGRAVATGSKVTISVPGGTVANGAVIDRYGIHNGTTLLRTNDLPITMTINDGSQAFQVDVTPVFKYRGE
ncbi:hypothetical protein [Mycobacteroides chelonae]|uniref:hypothetical protein n=1 Tax=Mycobacteroides chelonae TaxID=1774 RepID=UPI0004AA920E|nr:hypothetical protein [Mycobacteroides chelonae]OHT67778.1 hypothetical protein BKG66_24440 [Mycobacteroides chelonae]OHT69421.1 hypothetical protein BKG67_22975 [Mycobacteroides chelonae]